MKKLGLPVPDLSQYKQTFLDMIDKEAKEENWENSPSLAESLAELGLLTENPNFGKTPSNPPLPQPKTWTK